MSKQVGDAYLNNLYSQCLKEAGKLRNEYFSPALDSIEEETIDSILFKVLIEHDLLVGGDIAAPKRAASSWVRKVSKFMVKWRNYVPESDRADYMQFG